MLLLKLLQVTINLAIKMLPTVHGLVKGWSLQIGYDFCAPNRQAVFILITVIAYEWKSALPPLTELLKNSP